MRHPFARRLTLPLRWRPSAAWLPRACRRPARIGKSGASTPRSFESWN